MIHIGCVLSEAVRHINCSLKPVKFVFENLNLPHCLIVTEKSFAIKTNGTLPICVPSNHPLHYAKTTYSFVLQRGFGVTPKSHYHVCSFQGLVYINCKQSLWPDLVCYKCASHSLHWSWCLHCGTAFTLQWRHMNLMAFQITKKRIFPHHWHFVWEEPLVTDGFPITNG